MKEKRLLYAIGWVKDAYIEEMDQPGIQKKSSTMPKRKLWLIAAIVAVMVLLAGCVAVYLRLQDLSFGTESYVEEYSSSGLYIGPIEKTRHLLTIKGYVGGPHQLALQEWLEFKENYDPNGALLTNEPDIPEIPNAEETVYGCYTLDMVEKLHEIADKYDLKLLEQRIPIQRWQNDIALKALGTDSFLKPGAPAEIPSFSGMFYPPYSFKFEYNMTMTGEDALWPHKMMVGHRYHRKGYFQPLGYWSVDLSRVQQWNYTTSEGFDLLLVLDDRGRGHILLEKEEAYLTISLDTYIGQSKYPSPDEYISRAGLEQAAELFDYSIATPMLEFSAMEEELEAAEAAYRETQPSRSLPNYPDFDECLRREGPWRGPEGYDYTFYDVDADGEEELLFGLAGGPAMAVDLENGETQYRIYGNDYFCENGIIHSVHSYDFSTFEIHTFHNWPDFSLCLTRKNGVWHKSEETVDYASIDALPTLTEEEVQAIMDQYPHMQLQWVPVMEYTFADGTTVADIAVIPEPVTIDQLPQEYRKLAEEERFLTHGLIHDLDEDGIDELLLGQDSQTIVTVLGLRDGQIQELIPGYRQNLYPCQGGVWEEVLLMNTEGGVELEEHIFYHMVKGKPEPLHYVAWNKATASWVCDRDYTPMEAQNAKEILNRYIRKELTLLPIADLWDPD